MNIKTLIITQDLSIKDTMKKLDDTAKKILLVCDENKLKGIITDGDIRRWILKNGDLSASIRYVANYEPKFVYENQITMAQHLLKKYLIRL